MAFCAFDDSAALFDSTPVENMFITEYMLRAPGDFVKVYLYALMLCYHPTPRMSLSSMARDLDMTEEDVERAFKYWARDGLVRQVGDNPVSFTLFNLKQLTLTRAENPGDKLYNQKFIEEAERILKRTLQPEEINLINDWIQVLELPEEVVLMLLQIEMENSRGRVSISIAGGAPRNGRRAASARWTTWKRSSSWAGNVNSSSENCWRALASAARPARTKRPCTRRGSTNGVLHRKLCRKPAARRRRARRRWRISTAF